MDALLTQSSLYLPPGWRLPSHEWRRLAIRRPVRRHLVATRGIIDRVLGDEPPLALLQLSKSGLGTILRFVNCCPDLTYAIVAEDVQGYAVRCSRNLAEVRELVLEVLDDRRASQGAHSPVRESRRIGQRRERAFRAMELLVERLVERSDLSIVIAWRVAGDGNVNFDCSDELEPHNRHRWLSWFAQSVLDLEVDFPADVISSLDWLTRKLEAP